MARIWRFPKMETDVSILTKQTSLAGNEAFPREAVGQRR